MRSRLALLFALAVLVAMAMGCAGADADEEAEDDATADQALCSPTQRDVYLKVKAGTQAGVFLNTGRKKPSAILAPGTSVIRLEVRELAPDAPWSFVRVKNGPNVGMTGWVHPEELELRAPAGGSCASGVEYEAKASAFERAQSQPEPLPASALKSTVQCVIGFGEGVGSGAEGFVEGFKAVAVGAIALAQEILRRDQLVFLYMMGNADAAAALADIGANDRLRVNAAVSTIANAVPAVNAYLASQWVYYRALPPEAKAKYTCGLLGRLSFEVVAFLATSEVALARLATMMKRVETANVAFARLAEVPGRIGKSPAITLGHDFLASQEGAYWTRLQDRLDRLAVTTDRTERQSILRMLADDQNVPSKGYKDGIADWHARIGDGNCGNSAFSTIASLATGHVNCTMPYLTSAPDFQSPQAFIDALTQIGGRPEVLEITKSAAELEARLLAQLEEGQMVFLFQGGSHGGHATVVVRQGNELWNVNNQGWEKALGVPDGKLQTLGEWTRAFESRNGGSGMYMPMLTGLRMQTR